MCANAKGAVKVSVDYPHSSMGYYALTDAKPLSFVYC